MNLSELFASVGERLKAKAQQRAQTFAELVAAVDSGKPPKPDVIAGILEDSGRTVAELQSAVELVRQRRQWEAEAAEHDLHLAETHAIAQAREEAAERYRQALIELRRQHNETVATLEARYAAAAAGLERAAGARNRLIETSPQRDELYVLWRHRATAIRSKDGTEGGRDYERERRAAEFRVKRAEEDLRKAEARPAWAAGPSVIQCREELAAAQRVLQIATDALAKLDAEAAAANRRIEALEAEAVQA
jgi:hypothetical protein